MKQRSNQKTVVVREGGQQVHSVVTSSAVTSRQAARFSPKAIWPEDASAQRLVSESSTGLRACHPPCGISVAVSIG